MLPLRTLTVNSSKKKLSNGCETQGSKGIVKPKRRGDKPHIFIITQADRLIMEDDYSISKNHPS